MKCKPTTIAERVELRRVATTSLAPCPSPDPTCTCEEFATARFREAFNEEIALALLDELDALGQESSQIRAALETIGKQAGLHDPTPEYEIERAVVTEIERLRSEVQSQILGHRDTFTELENADKEIEQLRAELAQAQGSDKGTRTMKAEASSEITAKELAEMRRVNDAGTQGDYGTADFAESDWIDIGIDEGAYGEFFAKAESQEDAERIAMFDPPTVGRMLAALAAKDDEISRLREVENYLADIEGE